MILLHMDVNYPQIWEANFEVNWSARDMVLVYFWRASEILFALKKKVAIDFKDKMDARIIMV